MGLPYVLCVEGNIGSGKSTLLSNLKKRGFTVIEEPVKDIWGQYLPRLYEDTARWGFCFQMEAMDWFRQLQSTKFEHLLRKMTAKEKSIAAQQQLSEQKLEESADIDPNQENVRPSGDEDAESESREEPPTSPKKQLLSSPPHSPESRRVIIVERSALSSIGIFSKNLLESKLMTQWEYSLLQRFYSMIDWEAMHILYLQTEPEICCKRIKQRNRNGEHNMDPVMMSNLHAKHEDMFNKKGAIEAQNVLIVDGSKSSEKVLQQALFKMRRLEIPSKKICDDVHCCV